MTERDDLHEEEVVTLRADVPQPSIVLWEVLRNIGMSQEEDVFILPRSEKSIPPWQHDAYVEIDILREGHEIFDDDEVWDTINVVYPLARVPESGIPSFIEKATELAAELRLPMRYRGKIVTPEDLRAQLMEAVRELKQTIGAPGSEDVAIHIEASYPR